MRPEAVQYMEDVLSAVEQLKNKLNSAVDDMKSIVNMINEIPKAARSYASSVLEQYNKDLDNMREKIAAMEVRELQLAAKEKRLKAMDAEVAIKSNNTVLNEGKAIAEVKSDPTSVKEVERRVAVKEKEEVTAVGIPD